MEKYKIICTDCEFVCRAQATMKKHNEAVHSNMIDLTFDCNICDQEYSSQQRLEKHLLKEHDGKNHLECGKCDYKCNKEEELLTHLETHEGRKPFHCTVCEDSFSKQRHLRKHFKTIHEGKNPNKPMPQFPSGKVFYCSDCRLESVQYLNFRLVIQTKKKL